MIAIPHVQLPDWIKETTGQENIRNASDFVTRRLSKDSIKRIYRLYLPALRLWGHADAEQEPCLHNMKLMWLVFSILGLVSAGTVVAQDGGGGDGGGGGGGGGDHSGGHHGGGGHHHHGGHHHGSIGFHSIGGFYPGFGFGGFGFPGYYGGYGFGGYGFGMPYPYYPPYYAYPPVAAVPAAPPVYIQQQQQAVVRPPPPPPPQATHYWHYCRNPEGYYPYVRKCPDGWLQVAPQPATQ